MRNWKGFVAVWGLWMALAPAGPVARAQDPAAPAEDPPAEQEPAAVAPEPEEGDREKIPFALYVGFAGGTGSVDRLTTSISADDLNRGVSTVDVDETLYGRAAIGWQLPRAKGDFRLIFQGNREDSYVFHSVGVTNRLPTANADIDSGLVPWWFVDVDNGKLTARRFTPMWNSAADMNPDFGDADGLPDFGPCSDIGGGLERCGEITYDRNSPTREITGLLPDDLQNRMVTYDLVYGREFGGRRYSSRWWAGFRYYQYEGQMLAGAWLGSSGDVGEQFTDGSFLRLLRLSQDTTGLGPVGSWEAQFNFFDKGLQLFLRGEAAFTFNSMKMDSGPFFQIVDEAEGTTISDRLVKSLDKSVWQDRAEVGARVYLKSGLHFEIAYSLAGYLDAVLMPDLLQLGVTNENPQTSTQDLVIDSLHVGAAFQF